MARKLKSDRVLFLAVLFLVCVSAVMVCSASAGAALQRNWDVTRLLFKQATWVAVGALLMGVTMRIHYKAYQQPFVIWSGIGILAVSLMLVLLIAPEINGSRRWFRIGDVGIQPSELAKLVVILFVSDLLARRMERVNEPAAIVVPTGVVVGGLAALILLQPDLGTAVFLVLVSGVLIFAAGLSYTYLTGLAAVVVPTIVGLIVTSEYRWERVKAWLDPWHDPQDAGFQIIQSLLAVGTGGLTGRGFMRGLQKNGFLPEPQTDFIFAVISEEFGLIGALVVLTAFLVIAWRGYLVATRMPDRFGAFLALGLTTLIVAQALINMSVVLGILPNKGLPLPFISAGGSSMLISMLGMGILLNVSQHAMSSPVRRELRNEPRSES
jgi:cell division protein FtsW